MKIEDIQSRAGQRQVIFTSHAEEERGDEGLTAKDVETALAGGEILEEYPEDPRGPSCLVLGYSHGVPIHVICGQSNGGDFLVIITVYIPQLPKWRDPKTRAISS